MKVILLLTGPAQENYLKAGIEMFRERITHYVPFEIRDAGNLKNPGSLPPAEQMRREALLYEKHLQPGDCIVLLDEHGKEMTSVEFSSFLDQRFLSGARNLVFMIGGPFGFDPALKSRAAYSLALSRMTFPHQLVRLIFLEQLYRALTIRRNEAYHHE